MLLTDSCVKCLYNRQAALTDDEEYLSEVKRLLAHRKETDTAPYMVYQFNQAYERRFGKKYSYEKEKKECNDLLLGMQDELRKTLAMQREPLEKALSFSRIGNYMDYGALKEVDTDTFLRLFANSTWSEQDHEVYQSFFKACSMAKDFLLIADNCGEIVLDKLFLEVLKKTFPGLKVTVMVRGGNVLNDVTADDAEYVGLTDVADIVDNGRPVSGTIYSLLSEKAKHVLDHADVILAKGQGNYESLSKQGRHIFYLFLCKCDLFIERFGVPKFTGMFVDQ